MRAGGGYSRFVAWAKVILPMAALALLATLFLIARRIDPDAAIPFAEVDVEQYAREARIGAPEFSGVTSDGTVVSLSAALARPDPAAPSRMTVEDLVARFDIADGSTVAAEAGRGAVGGAGNRLELGGGVSITTSTGYRIETAELFADLAETGLRSGGPVAASGPPGRIEAGLMTISPADAAPESYLLVFSDGVKLVYEPEN